MSISKSLQTRLSTRRLKSHRVLINVLLETLEEIMIFFPITLKLLCLISQVHKIWVGILLNFFLVIALAVLINLGANLSATLPIVICSAMLYTRIFLCLNVLVFDILLLLLYI